MIIKKIHIDNNSLESYNVMEVIKELPAGKYRVYICNDKKQRSLEQNAYYWGVVIKTISDETGFTLDETHKKLAFMFNPEMIEVKGEFHKIPRSTKELNTKEFTEYLEQIRIWANQFLGLQIPEPNQFTEEETIHFDSEHL